MYKIYIKENTTSDNILKEALKDYANITHYELSFNEYGKPRLKNKDIYFNITHSGNVVVCVVSDKDIGVDIEKIGYKKKVLNKAFNEKEKEMLYKSKNKDILFTIMWTIKESYVKMLGIGLSYGLKNVDSTSLRNEAIIKYYQDYVISIIESKE